MKRHPYLAVLTLLLSLSIPALGQNGDAVHTCSDADFVGRYAFQGSGFVMTADPPAPTSVAGALVADGAGRIVWWKDWLTLPGAQGPVKRVIPNDLVAAAAAADSALVYTVEADCRMSISGTVAGPNGPLDLNLLGGLADGGAEAFLQSGSPVFIGAWTAKRASSSTAAGENNSEKADAIKALLDRMAVRLSVLP